MTGLIEVTSGTLSASCVGCQPAVSQNKLLCSCSIVHPPTCPLLVSRPRWRHVCFAFWKQSHLQQQCHVELQPSAKRSGLSWAGLGSRQWDQGVGSGDLTADYLMFWGGLLNRCTLTACHRHHTSSYTNSSFPYWVPLATSCLALFSLSHTLSLTLPWNATLKCSRWS